MIRKIGRNGISFGISIKGGVCFMLGGFGSDFEFMIPMWIQKTFFMLTGILLSPIGLILLIYLTQINDSHRYFNPIVIDKNKHWYRRFKTEWFGIIIRPGFYMGMFIVFPFLLLISLTTWILEKITFGKIKMKCW